jgi:hypothetical protein
MSVVVDAPSIEPAVVLLTFTTELMHIKSIETPEYLESNEVCIKVTKSDDIIPECRRAVSTSVADNLSVA